ncbi:MAG: sporulation protein YtfJ [Oscillospiraceae bacterium]|nr:sporulation protein YtfJ [Ruminococcus sp.]MDE6707277.1 sporulation protein YtfJ [Oscillospiraceae bacterium]
MSEQHVINEFVGTSMDKIRSLIDSDTMMGNPITCGDGTTVIPVSKISVGFASGGSDIPTRTSKEYFAGGAGGGISVKPVGFLVIKDEQVRLMQMTMEADKTNVFMEKVPEIIDKISDIVSKGKNQIKSKSKTKKKAEDIPVDE